MKKIPIIPTKMIGITFNITVIFWTKPIVFISLEFIHVNSHIIDKPVIIEYKGDVLREGIKTLKYPKKATTIAVFVDQIEIQYPQATRNAGNLPKTFLVNL